MKLSFSSFAAIWLAVSHVQATNLIRGIHKPEQSAESLTEAEFGTATIVISHASSPGKWNNKVLSDAFKKAYNDVHNGGDAATVEWVFIDTEVETPEDDVHVPGSGRYWESTNWCQYKYSCPSCSPEDKRDKKLLPPLMLGALDYPDLHSQFESAFCDLIRSADPASFGDVRQCQIDFTYSLSTNLGQHYHGSTDNDESDFNGVMHGEIDLSHILKSRTGDNAAVLESQRSVLANCFVDTYNLIHSDSPFRMTEATIDSVIDIPEDDDDDEDGPGAMVTSAAAADGLDAYYFLRFREWSRFRGGWGCRRCGPDDRKFIPPLTMARLTMGEHQAFEATFANCVRESGVAAFAKVANPHIRFSYTGNQEME